MKHLNKLDKSLVKRQKLMMESNVDTKFAEFKQQFFNELKEVEKYSRSSNLTIKNVISRYPKTVSNVAKIVTALPPTQVSVERLFFCT